MHIENFKIFGDLVEAGSFSRAARKNSVTQSAVSQQLRTIEKHFNVIVMDRGQKNFELTAEGKKLYDGTRDILQRYEILVSELQEMKKIIAGNIQISTVYSIGLHELPPYVKGFLQDYPDVNIRVEYRRSNLVYDDVINNSVDLGLVAYPEKRRQLEVVPFIKDRLVLIAHPEHRVASLKGPIDIKEIADEPLVTFEKDIPTRKAIDEVYREAGMKMAPSMEFDNVETVKRAVEINAGVAIIPRLTAAQEIKQGLLVGIELEGEAFDRPLALIYRQGRVLTPAMKMLIQRLTGIEIEDQEPTLIRRRRRARKTAKPAEEAEANGK